MKSHNFSQLSFCIFTLLFLCLLSPTQAQTKNNIKERKTLFKEIVESLQKGDVEVKVGVQQLFAIIRGGLLNPKLIQNNKLLQQKLAPDVMRELIQKAKIHRDRFLKRENKEMAALMDTLIDRDQKYRMAASDCQ